MQIPMSEPRLRWIHRSPEETRGKADPNFTGWGRKAGDYKTGEWVFETVKPGVSRGIRKLDVPCNMPLVRSVLA